MRVFIISLHYLDSFSGGSLASMAFINAFSEISTATKLMFPFRGRPVLNSLNSKCDLVPIFDNRSRLKKLIDLYSGKIHRFDKKLVLAQVESVNPDVIVFDNSRCVLGLIDELSKSQKKIITIHHNFESEYFKSNNYSLTYRFPLSYYIKKAEYNALLLSNLNLTLTKQDMHLFINNYPKVNQSNINHIGCFEPQSHIPSKIKNEKNDCLKLVITGSLSSSQTNICIVDFLENYFPLIQTRLNNFELIIAGKSPTNKIIELCGNFHQIKLIINPTGIIQHIQSADIYVCPIYLGGGLKLRIMDGLKCGLPVLSHEISARGYDKLVISKSVFKYYDKWSFVNTLEKLALMINKKEINKNKIQNDYYSQFSFDEGVKKLSQILNENFNRI